MCLQEGLGLNINRLIRRGFLKRGTVAGPYYLTWSYRYSEERIAAGILTSDLSEPGSGWVRIELGTIKQTVHLVSQPRHLGGRQWYFRCPTTALLASTLWLPAGASRFASRQSWGRQVAYSSQFQSRHDRALARAQAIRARLGGANWAGIDEFDPPKPKGMRWATYTRLIDSSRQLEVVADEQIFSLLNQWQRLS